jgi:outer membrane lipoprotein-sorting protein
MAAWVKRLWTGRNGRGKPLFPPGIRALFLGGLLFCLILTAPPQARGEVLSGPHILELMVKALSSAQTLRVEQRVVVEEATIADHPLELNETLSYAFNDRFRSDTHFKNTERIHVVAQDQTLTVIDGRRIVDANGRFDQYKDLLLYRTRAALHKALLSHGVDVGKTSLGRYEDRIVYVVGAQYPDNSVSQVWVDKETFLPLRWLHVSSRDPNDRLIFAYNDWQKNGGLWYPMLVETLHGKKTIRRILVSRVQVNATLAPASFNIPQMKIDYPQEESTGILPGLDPSREVQLTIEAFQKKFSD